MYIIQKNINNVKIITLINFSLKVVENSQRDAKCLILFNLKNIIKIFSV